MARINIEDSIDTRIEYKRLVKLVGDEERAMGRLVMWFRLAQHYFIKNKPVPTEQMEFFEHIIESGWAVPYEGGYQTIGCLNQFKWLLQKINAGKRGGIASGKAKALKISSRLKHEESEAAVSGSEADSKHSSSGYNPPSLTIAPNVAPTLTQSQKKERKTRQARFTIAEKQIENALPLDYGSQNISDGAAPPPDTLGLQNLCRDSWNSYAEAFQKRYGIAPLRNARVNSQIKKFCQDVGSDAPNVLDFYLSHNDSFYLANQHAIGFAVNNSSQLYTQFKRGRAVTRSDVKAFEKHDALRAQIERIRNGEI